MYTGHLISVSGDAVAKQAKGEIHADLYGDCCQRLETQVAAERFDDALAVAVESFEYIPLTINLLGRNDEAIPRFYTIDFVLEYAPVFLHAQSLRELSDFLKRKRAVVQKLPFDVMGELDNSNEQLSYAHTVWNYLVVKSPVSNQQLCEELMASNNYWEHLASKWVKLGMLLCDESSSEKRWTLIGSRGHKIRGKCPNCGATGGGGLYKLLEEIQCPKCQAKTTFVVLSLQV